MLNNLTQRLSKVVKTMRGEARLTESNTAEMLREDLESKGPVRLSEVEAEQKEILKIVRRLAEEGQITIGGGSEDSFV